MSCRHLRPPVFSNENEYKAKQGIAQQQIALGKVSDTLDNLYPQPDHCIVTQLNSGRCSL